MKNNEPDNFIIKKKRGFGDYSRNDFFRFVVQVIGFVAIVFVGAGFLGFLPEEVDFFTRKNTVEPEVSDNIVSPMAQESINVETSVLANSSVLPYAIPQTIKIPKVDIKTIVEIPTSQEINVLNESLEKGAVYYPESGNIAEGNMFIFGHSSNWKLVQNQAYKTFNGIEELVPGDEIILEADGREYIYEVAQVSLVNDDEALVEIGGTGRKLTLSTCNSFGEKQERWVVEAYPKSVSS